jgi:hypothetical protein
VNLFFTASHVRLTRLPHAAITCGHASLQAVFIRRNWYAKEETTPISRVIAE